MIKKDEFICSSIDKLLEFKANLNRSQRTLLKKMEEVPPVPEDKSVMVVLNGPSIKSQDLRDLNENVDIAFVNRGFMHPHFKELKPKYHVFIDPKMLSGEWKLSWIFDIVKMIPDITIVLPVSWAFKTEFCNLNNFGIKIHWIPDYKKCFCVGVSGNCFDFLASRGYKTIYFTGFDANGLPLEMLNTSNSHFYGKNEENLRKDSKNYIQDLYMYSRHFSDLHKLSKRYRERKVRLINLTEGGLLDMFERKSIDSIKKV